jgi:prepilin-type N-terminal cleavage/methylation domain-containing protein
MDGDKMINQKGFSLIEVMIALVVLLVGMLGVMAMQYYAVSGNTSSRELRIATNLTQEIVEQIKTTPYTNLAAGTDLPPVGTAISGGLNFMRRWWIVPDCIALSLPASNVPCSNLAAACTSDPDGTAAVSVSAIRARACWTDKYGGNHSVTLDTLRWDENVVP